MPETTPPLRPEQRRKFFRLDISLPIEISDSRGSIYAFKTSNLSAGGVNVVADGAFPVNTYVKLKFPLESPADTVTTLGLVKWNRHLPDQKKWSMGIEFVQLEEAGRDKIQKFLNKKALELRRRGLM